MEEWKLIPESKGRYSVSNAGRIRREHFYFERNGKQVEMKPKIIDLKKHGSYFSFGFSLDNKIHMFLVHRLVAINFIENPMRLPVVNHIDMDKENNNVSNLEWVSVSDNNRHFRSNMSVDKRKQSKEFEFYNFEGEEFRYCSENNVYVSNYGRVWGMVRNKMAFKLIHSSHCGYQEFTVGDKHVSLHRSVAKLFCDNSNNHSLVNHKNGVKSDSRASNLEWVSRSYNSIHSFTIGLNRNIGENNSVTNKKEEEVKRIVEMIKSGMTVADIAKQTGFKKQFIAYVRDGKTWRYFTGINKKPIKDNKISDEKVADAKIMYHKCGDAVLVSNALGISSGYLWKILTGAKRADIRPDLTKSNVSSARHLSNEEVDNMIQMYKSGHTFVSISKITGRDRDVISKAIKKKINV